MSRIYSEEAELYDIAFDWLDTSKEMLDLARARGCDVVRADMTDFDLGRRFDGAVSAVSTVGVLGPDGLASHLESMARHLEPGARYLVQQGVFAGDAELWRSEWEAERGGTKLHVVWEAIDRERSRSRVEITAGPRAGEVVEDEHVSAYSSVGAWRRAIADSPFSQVACYDEGAEVDLGRGGHLLWHELVVP